MNNEYEVKFLHIDKVEFRKNLLSNNFKLTNPEYIMKRRTFDFSKITPGKNKWGRVRQEANKVTMTIKEIRGDGINDTYETELIVDDFEKASSFFEECSIHVKSFQENKRELWEKDNIKVTIDTWPGIESFVEIEGVSTEEVMVTSKELGFVFENGLFGSIDMVYQKVLGIPAKELITLPEITFSNPPKKINK
jgi:adenylate cyclase class 2